MTHQTSSNGPADAQIGLPALPSAATLKHLFTAGYIALMAWEIWSRTITDWVVGGPLEPPALVVSLVEHWTGYELRFSVATFLHYVVGIVGYPLAYYYISRGLRNWSLILDVLVLGIFTLFLGWRIAKYGFEPGNALFWLVVALFTASRFINPSALWRDSLSWGSFTWYNALGIMAPLAGLPFLLLDAAPLLSFMSWVGHILFGFLVAFVFEKLEAKSAGS